MRLFFLIIATYLQLGNTLAQGIKFYVQTDAREILDNSYVDVEFVLENADGKNFRPPSFKDFRIIAGPNRSSSMSIVNGKMNKKMSYGYTLRPLKTGSLTIGAATIESFTGILSTESLTIEVIKADQNTKRDNRDFFVETSLSDSTAYVGQQVILSYKLYTRLDIRSYNIDAGGDFEGFYTQPINTEREPTRREIINGIEYTTKLLRKIALYPQQRGIYKIEPAVVTLGIASNRSSRSFFFSNQLKNERILTDALEILVDNTPNNAPSSFSGAVGEYKMNARIEKRTLTTDDALVINMNIWGDGDSKTVLPPRWMESDSFDIYDPNTLRDSLYFSNGKRMHKKVYEYLLVPKYPGTHILKPEFSFFSPDTQDYVTIQKVMPPINVLQGSGTAIKDVRNEEAPLELSHDTSIKAWPDKIHGSLYHNLFLVFMGIAVAAIFIYMAYLKKSGRTNPAYLARQKARNKALKRLSELEALKSEKTSAFYEELTRALKQFVEDKYAIPALHINRSEVMHSLQNVSQLDAHQIKMFDVLFEEAEKAMYAPGLSSSPEKLYDEALQLISELES